MRSMDESFTPRAAVLWAALTPDEQRLYVESTWCAHCLQGVVLVGYKGRVKGGDLILEGFCKRCNGPVARLIETA